MQPDGIEIDNEGSAISIHFTPTIPHCSMSTLIGYVYPPYA
jgi:metal-sulfur cluster biosynthetic enzyme